MRDPFRARQFVGRASGPTCQASRSLTQGDLTQRFGAPQNSTLRAHTPTFSVGSAVTAYMCCRGTRRPTARGPETRRRLGRPAGTRRLQARTTTPAGDESDEGGGPRTGEGIAGPGTAGPWHAGDACPCPPGPEGGLTGRSCGGRLAVGRSGFTALAPGDDCTHAPSARAGLRNGRPA